MSRALGALAGAAGSQDSRFIHLGYSRSRISYTRETSPLDPAHAPRLARDQAQRQHCPGQDPADHEHGLRARGLGRGPGRQVAHRQQDQRTHPFVRARPRERERRDALGHRRVPEDVEQREARRRWPPRARAPPPPAPPTANATSMNGQAPMPGMLRAWGAPAASACPGGRPSRRRPECGRENPEDRGRSVALLSQRRAETNSGAYPSGMARRRQRR